MEHLLGSQLCQIKSDWICIKQTRIYGCHLHEIWIIKGKGHAQSLCLWRDKLWITTLCKLGGYTSMRHN